jgi:hypothetical protein
MNLGKEPSKSDYLSGRLCLLLGFDSMVNKAFTVEIVLRFWLNENDIRCGNIVRNNILLQI